MYLGIPYFSDRWATIASETRFLTSYSFLAGLSSQAVFQPTSDAKSSLERVRGPRLAGGLFDFFFFFLFGTGDPRPRSEGRPEPGLEGAWT